MTKEKTESKNLFQRLHKVMELVGNIPKSGWNKAQQYKFVTESDVMDKMREAALLEGVLLIPSELSHAVERGKYQNGGEFFLTTVEIEVEAINIDDPSERYKWKMIGQGADAQDKGSNKAVTGAVKYGLLKPFLVGTGDDAEDEKEDHARPQQHYSAPVANKPTYAQATARQERGQPAQEGPPPITDAEVASIAFSLDDDTPDFMRPEPIPSRGFAPARPGEVFKYAGKGIYDRKEEIKAGGAKWDKDKKVWESDHPIPGFEQYLVGATQNG